MRTCVICRYPVEIDDVAVTGPQDRCICLRCYERETGTQKPMPKDLRRWLETATEGVK